MPTITFQPGYHPAILALLAVAALLLVGIGYARAFGALKARKWLLLYVLRLAAIVIVLLLLFRPVLSFQRDVIQRRGVVFLIDRSASMSVTDDGAGGSRLENAMDRVAAWWRKLSTSFDPLLIAFADTPEFLEGLDSLATLHADGEATSLSRALTAAAQTKIARNPEAVFLLSDGIHNGAGDPALLAQHLGVPVYAVGVGNVLRDRASYHDIRLTGVDVPEQMAVKNRARIRGYVEAIGYSGRVVTALLEEDQQEVARQEVVLDDVEGSQEMTFEFLPQSKGLHTYTIRIPPLADEKIPQNNARSASALVADARIRVLYVEGTLRAEYGALVGRFLSKDPNVEFCSLIQTRPNVFLHRSNMEGLELSSIPSDAETMNRFDVFILGDLDSSYLQPEQVELLQQRVEQGAGLLMLGGYHSLGPGGYGTNPLGAILPVLPGDREIGQITEPFQMELTPDGRRHPIFANIIQFFPSAVGEAEITGLPPLEGCVRVAGARPSATVLAIHPTVQTSRGQPMPVLATQPVGDGRTAVFTGDTTRNWHQTMRTLDRETPFLRFWGQMVRWLAGRDDQVETEAGISATTDKAYYEPGGLVTIRSVVRGEEGEAADSANVTAVIHDPRGRSETIQLGPTGGPAGNYQATFEPEVSGRYEIQVSAAVDDQQLDAEPLQIDVGRPDLEFDRLDLDEQMLVNIAQQSGGRYAHISTADRLIDWLIERQQKRRVQWEVPLYWPPVLWVLFVAVVTLEWSLRRRFLLR